MLKYLGDFLALVSVLALAVPAWYANRYGHRLAKINLNGLRLGEPEFQTQYAEVLKDLQEQRDGWKPWKAWCFYVGKAAGLAAAALLLWHGLYEPVATAAH